MGTDTTYIDAGKLRCDERVVGHLFDFNGTWFLRIDGLGSKVVCTRQRACLAARKSTYSAQSGSTALGGSIALHCWQARRLCSSWL